MRVSPRHKTERAAVRRESREPASARSSRMWWGASLVAIALVMFWGAVGDDFVLDGVALVRDNHLLVPFDAGRIVTLDWWAGTGKPGGLYRPVALLALGALRAVGGGGPGAINFANVLLHGLVAWLHFALLARFLGERPGARAIAWLAALIALVHPLNVEVVAGQVGIADLLASFWMCAAVLVAERPTRLRFVLGALMALVAALSKETGVLVVPLAVLFEWLREQGDSSRTRRIRRAFAWSSAGVVVALALRWLAIGTLTGADDPVYAGFSAVARVASACATFASYSLTLLFAPWRQLAVVSLQDAPPATGFGDARALIGVIVLLAAVLGPWFALRRGRRDVAFGVWFFVIAWLPTSNLAFSSGAVAASRFFYAGLFALALPLTAFVVNAIEGTIVRRVVAGILAAWFVVAMSVVSWRETATWRNQHSLLEAQVARAPSSAYALVDLATAIRSADPKRAIGLFDAAAESKMPVIPGNVPPEDLLESAFVARMGSAELRDAAGEHERAEQDYRAAEEIASKGQAARAILPFRDDWNAHRLQPLQKLAAASLARAKAASGPEKEKALDAAQRDLDAADACDPASSESVRLRSILLERRGDAAGRSRLVEEAWKKNPADDLLQILWANELRQRGRVDEALAIEIDVASRTFDRFDPARCLAIAKEAFSSADPRLVSAARALLERLSRLDPVRSQGGLISSEAARTLRGK
jgi:hypothetical protein